MSHKIRKVEYLEGYKLKLYFENKRVKVVDLASMLKEAKNMLAPLADLEYFKKVKCDGVTIVWPNGVDLCPDTLYRASKEPYSTKSKMKRSARVSKTRKHSKQKISN